MRRADLILRLAVLVILVAAVALAVVALAVALATDDVHRILAALVAETAGVIAIAICLRILL